VLGTDESYAKLEMYCICLFLVISSLDNIAKERPNCFVPLSHPCAVEKKSWQVRLPFWPQLWFVCSQWEDGNYHIHYLLVCNAYILGGFDSSSGPPVGVQALLCTLLGIYLPLPTITINFFVYMFLPQHVYCSYTQISCAHVPTTTYPSLWYLKKLVGDHTEF
jgi:hypothetical protein